MKIEFDKLKEQSNLEFKGGVGEFLVRTFADERSKIMYGKLKPAASIGYHKHETNCEIIYILEGSGKCLYDDGEEQLQAGDCHYCPKGHSHSLINDSGKMLVFFAVVPEQ